MSDIVSQNNDNSNNNSSPMVSLLTKLLGKIMLKKSSFFGLDTHKITVIISPSMKIYGVYASPERIAKKFPFEKKKILSLKELKRWAEDNEFEISFSAETPKLRRDLLISLGDVMVESKGKKERELNVIIMEELKKSKLPDSIKEWAKDNPEKFIKNIRHVQNILKK
jgi:hypothetical protein|tara:strand:- start:219 stop:719 length:501 start_codon:yes stop_codon:yes gene_type:complete